MRRRLIWRDLLLFSEQKSPQCRWQVVCCHSSLENLTQAGMISDRIGLNSVLLPFHLSVTHNRKSDESNLPTEYGFHFFLFFAC